MLKPNPKEWIDWSDFFKHPLFNKFDSEIGEGLDDIMQALGNALQKSKQHNDMFNANKNDQKIDKV